MEIEEQQKQSLAYFDSAANEWNFKAEAETYNVIKNRHAAVQEVLATYPTNSQLLDVGCGTGQLAVEASQLGYDTKGIDFAPEMIKLARSNAESKGVKASFTCISVFDADPQNFKSDVVSAQGFIEYVSLDQLEEFFIFSRQALRQGGSLVVGSRNRLFNVTSFNSYTDLEMNLGTISDLIAESLVFAQAESQAELLSKLPDLRTDYPHPAVHPRTGIGVDTRYQFTPAELASRMAKFDLLVSAFFPVNYHSVPVSLKGSPEYQEIYDSVARYVERKDIRQTKLIPYSSSFVIHATRL
jgi:2-polyprenyl-3-methyl-5-hydroxy-6-metoxy-1,4-benzoquinol methylase